MMKRKFECLTLFVGMLLLAAFLFGDREDAHGQDSKKSSLQLHVKENGVPGLSREESLSEINLRGYGNVSAAFWKSPEGSILQIDCEDTQTALLTHAKYLSDLQTTPYELKKTSVPETALSAWEVNGQGLICALCDGTQVFIVASPELTGLQKLIRDGISGETSAAISEAKAEVPMWLDRWDQYGFRFYYRPWEKPKSGAFQGDDYDISEEFGFAEKSDRSGFVFWATKMRSS